MKCSVYLIHSAPHHKDVWGSEGKAPLFLTSTIVGDEWSASRLFRFTSEAHCIGGWEGPRTGLDAVEKRK
jgi:hypothetical protein